MKECEKSEERHEKEDDKERLKENWAKIRMRITQITFSPPKMEERCAAVIKLRLSINNAKQQQQ